MSVWVTDAEYIEKARELYQRADGDVEVDDSAKVSRGTDPGAYVQAWVWVPNAAFEEVEEECSPKRFRNHYRHIECHVEWEDDWSCTCNDTCPECGAEIEPYYSEDLDEDGNVIETLHHHSGEED